jgi:DNA-binding PadR family transcriptional regulator
MTGAATGADTTASPTDDGIDTDDDPAGATASDANADADTPGDGDVSFQAFFALNAFRKHCLLAIHTDESDRPHGLALKDTLEEWYDEEIHHGRLYPNLDTLRDKGFVEKGTLDKRTNYYALADDVADVLREYVAFVAEHTSAHECEPTDSPADAEYVLTDAAGDPIPGEVYDDPDDALDARANLMSEHEDGDDVTVEEREVPAA